MQQSTTMYGSVNILTVDVCLSYVFLRHLDKASQTTLEHKVTDCHCSSIDMRGNYLIK